MRVQPALQHALLEYRLCRDWRDWRPNWISFSTQPIACLHGYKVTTFLFCPPFCPRFPPVQASHGNALLVAGLALWCRIFKFSKNSVQHMPFANIPKHSFIKKIEKNNIPKIPVSIFKIILCRTCYLGTVTGTINGNKQRREL
jgi:hypothetical protein